MFSPQLSASTFLLGRRLWLIPVGILLNLQRQLNAFHTLKEYFTPSQLINVFGAN